MFCSVRHSAATKALFLPLDALGFSASTHPVIARPLKDPHHMPHVFTKTNESGALRKGAEGKLHSELCWEGKQILAPTFLCRTVTISFMTETGPVRCIEKEKEDTNKMALAPGKE